MFPIIKGMYLYLRSIMHVDVLIHSLWNWHIGNGYLYFSRGKYNLTVVVHCNIYNGLIYTLSFFDLSTCLNYKNTAAEKETLVNKNNHQKLDVNWPDLLVEITLVAEKDQNENKFSCLNYSIHFYTACYSVSFLRCISYLFLFH